LHLSGSFVFTTGLEIVLEDDKRFKGCTPGSAVIFKRKGENKMQFMAILNYDCAKRREVLKRRAEKGTLTGSKVIGEWSVIGGGRVFRVIEADDPRIILEGARAWNDFGLVELIPVMSTEDIIKLSATQI
jgi:hypothetical protein